MIKTKIQQDLIAAMKAKEQERVEALRMVISEIKNKEIDTKTDMSDDEVVKLIRGVIKKLREAADMFAQGGRIDLVAQNQAQIAIYATYVPADLSDDALAEKSCQYNAHTPRYICTKPQNDYAHCHERAFWTG
ncbi:MAG: Yqey-like protein [Microgenomates bacterium OLB23]|nr:MAG: Yqey-like protein [Microgenomates bacterium OLB23]